MYKLISTAVIFTLSLTAYSAEREVCLPPPTDMKLSGATFAEAFKLKPSRISFESGKAGCGFHMQIVPRELDDLEISHMKQLSEWDENYEPPIYCESDLMLGSRDIPTECSYRASKEMAYRRILKNNPLPKLAVHDFDLKGTELCLSDASDSKCLKDTPVLLKSKGKIVGVMESNEHSGYIFSVNAQGKKDLSKPYIKINSKGQRAVGVRAMHNGEEIGNMDVNGTFCSTAAAPKSGSLELSGFKYSSSSISCMGGFTQIETLKNKAKQAVAASK